MPELTITRLEQMLAGQLTLEKCRKCKANAKINDKQITSLWSCLLHTKEISFASGSVPLFTKLPSEIKFSEKTFKLRGVTVSLLPVSTDANAIGHYTVYCLRSNDRWQFFDDLGENEGVYAKKTTVIDCDISIYTS